MHISDLVFKKKKIFYFLLIAIVLGGYFSFQKLSKLEDPEITVMMANVITVYPGASAHDVEMQVTNVLEDELTALADINSLESRSEANVSIIKVELKMTVPQEEIPQRWEFLRRKLELAAPKLPKGTRTPIVIDDVGDVYGMFYAMVGDDSFSYEELADYADLIERNMLDVKGVRKVSVYGNQKPEIIITLSADKMSEMGVLPLQIFSALQDNTKELYAGALQTGNNELRVSIGNKATTVDDIKNILLSSISGDSFTLGDIATVTLDYNKPLRNTMYVNNQKAIGIGISMESGENIIEVGERVEAKLAQVRKQIPLGINFEKVFFQPEKVSDSIDSFMLNLILSVVIVIFVLIFTMGFKGGLIIGSGLILTILATFPFLLTADGTLQRISLGAFIIAMGMLVDNAIVVLDGVLIQKQRGIRGKKLYTTTAKQTATPLLGATIIAIAAFFPVFLSPDTAGTYVRDLFIVLAISLSISWVLALTQVPLFSALLYKGEKKKKKNVSQDETYNKVFYKWVKFLLGHAMKHRLITIAITLVLLVIVVLNSGSVDKTFFPDFNYNQCYIEHTLPKGSTPEMVQEHLAQITNYFNSFDEVKMVTTSHGMTPMRYCLVRGMMTENADNYGELIVNFDDYETMVKMRKIFNEYLRSQFPESISRIRKYNLSIKATHSVEAEFSGPDPAVLKNLSAQVKDVMLQNKNVDAYTICDDWYPQAKTLQAIYNPIAANRANVTRNDVSNAILAATDGLPVATVHNGENSYPVRFCVRDKNGERIQDLNDIPVWSTIPNVSGLLNSNTIMGLYTGSTSTDKLIRETITAVPLSTVTNGVAFGWEEPVVRRRNGKRTIQAQCEPVDGVSAAFVQEELDELVQQIELPEGYSFRWVGESELKADGLRGIISYAPLAAGIILLVLLLLFNDYRRPLIIILCLPMSIIGIVPGLLMTSQPFSFIAIVGVLGLTGMIIKNAIVLLDEIQIQLKTNTSKSDAVFNATISRVRPVIMASLTTILGMLPLLIDPMYAAMAVSIIAGLIVGTLITLILVPVLYSLFYKIKVTH